MSRVTPPSCCPQVVPLPLEEVVQDPRYKNLRQEQVQQVQEGQGELEELDTPLKKLDNINTWIDDIQILATVPKRH